MSLVINKNLLSVNKLISQGIEIKGDFNSCNSEAIHILIVNLMPKKSEAEFQFLNIFGHMPIDIKVDFLQMETYIPQNTDKTYLEEYYKTLSNIENNSYEGMIITGAPLEFLDFDDIEYWKELKEVIDYSKKKAKSTLYICWAAIAGLYHNYGINKCVTKEKIFGVFPHVVVNKRSVLLKGFNDGFIVPHSRYVKLRKEDIEEIKELEILSESDEAGIYIVSSKDGKQIYITGHPEYDKYTLKEEYERDIKRGVNINLPKNYFPNDDHNKKPNLDWSSYSKLLFTNWINEYLFNS